MKGTDRDLASRSLPFILEGVALVVFLDQSWGEDILLAFPGIVSHGISFPLDKILETTSLPEIAMIDDGLNLEFFFSINDVWGRSWEVASVLVGFYERRQEAGMEDVMDGPGRG